MNGACKVLAFLGLGFLLFRAPMVFGEESVGQETVGERGNPQQLVLEGNTTFSSSAIKATLTWDFDVLTAAHPAAPWSEFLAVIDRKIVAGYRTSGFPDVRVEVHPDRPQGKVHVHIDEGPRYLAGDVKIIGARTLSTKLLTERLTKPYWSQEALESGKTDAQSKMENPVWEAGKPAYFPARKAKPAADVVPRHGGYGTSSSPALSDSVLSIPYSGPVPSAERGYAPGLSDSALSTPASSYRLLPVPDVSRRSPPRPRQQEPTAPATACSGNSSLWSARVASPPDPALSRQARRRRLHPF